MYHKQVFIAPTFTFHSFLILRKVFIGSKNNPSISWDLHGSINLMKNIKRQTMINRRIWPMCKVKKHDWNFAVGSVNPTADVIIRWRCRQGYKTSTGAPYAITFYAKSWGPVTKYYINYKFPIFLCEFNINLFNCH